MAVASAQVATSPDGAGALAAQLTAQIAKDQAAAAAGGGFDFSALRLKLAGFLNTAQPVASQIALKVVSQHLDALLEADICGAPAGVFDPAVKASTCAAYAPRSEAGKIGAVLGFADALAVVAKSDKPSGRGQQWLAAAGAIIAAQQADADLQAQAAQLIQAAAQQTLDGVVVEASLLARAQLALDAGKGTDGGKSGCRGDAGACGFVFYSQAWNRGRIPGEVLAARDFQVTREFAVRRARAAAERESLVIKAASAHLKSYVDGGVDPKLAAQLLFDAALIGTTAP